jgi:hypothetical protein
MQWAFRYRWAWFAVGLAALGTFGLRTAAAESPERYPYDPACAWGRLADGHGMLIRCLEPAEASHLLQQPSAPAAKPATTSAAAGSAAPPAATSAANSKLTVSNIGPVQADSGELPLAVKKLSLPKDRYIECVQRNGGLTASTAKVVVRFLVRERGRAEGVSVKSFQGVSAEAARCIADVVDRRYVGYPAAPIVGATIPIELAH